MIFLTVNDAPSGVYKSQVIEVVRYLNRISSEKTRLVAFISSRGFLRNRRVIRSWWPDATVLPMVPGLKRWKQNAFLLGLLKGVRRERIVARGVMAFHLASRFNRDVIYDGRGAVKAELTEFPDMIGNHGITQSLIAAEREAVLKASMRIAVSEELVNYWRSEYQYEGAGHVVIPCTISREEISPDTGETDRLRAENGFQPEDIVLVYSGSIAGWQSLHLLEGLLERWILHYPVKVLFLSPENEFITILKKRFPGVITRKWVSPGEVQEFLKCADYGMLIRENNVTNRVSSPVKFAEYLAAGLRVLISPQIGDYSQLVRDQNLGEVITEQLPVLDRTNASVRSRLAGFASQYLSKEAFIRQYRSLTE